MLSWEFHSMGPAHLFSHTDYWRSTGKNEFPLDWRESRVMMETQGAFHKWALGIWKHQLQLILKIF